MHISIVGGMDRLGRHYLKAARQMGITLSIFNRAEVGLARKIQGSHAVVLFTGHVSHRARDEVVSAARARDIPIYRCHSCGVSTLRKCMRGLGAPFPDRDLGT